MKTGIDEEIAKLKTGYKDEFTKAFGMLGRLLDDNIMPQLDDTFCENGHDMNFTHVNPYPNNAKITCDYSKKEIDRLKEKIG